MRKKNYLFVAFNWRWGGKKEEITRNERKPKFDWVLTRHRATIATTAKKKYVGALRETKQKRKQ